MRAMAEARQAGYGRMRLAATKRQTEAIRLYENSGFARLVTDDALDEELTPLLAWMHGLDEGLGRSAETAGRKMRYQMNRLRRLAANFQMQREESLKRHADAIARALYPGGVLQERLHGAAYYFGHYGFELAERLTAEAAASTCNGHASLWL